MITELTFRVFLEPYLGKYFMNVSMNLPTMAWFRDLVPETKLFEMLRDERFPTAISHSDDHTQMFVMWILPISLAQYMQDRFGNKPYAKMDSLTVYQEVEKQVEL